MILGGGAETIMPVGRSCSSDAPPISFSFEKVGMYSPALAPDPTGREGELKLNLPEASVAPNAASPLSSGGAKTTSIPSIG